MAIKFGPAGLGGVKEAELVLEKYHKLGFKACEIPFTYSVYIKKQEDAERIGKKAKELGIDLSIHGQYWINLNSSEAVKREASKQRILECCKVGEWLGAKRVVFHPGYYGKNKETAAETISSGIQEVMKEIKKNGWKIKIAVETMGRLNVFGSLEQVRWLVDKTGCSFCIDFAHILARDKKVDYEKIRDMFPEKEWHCHFSGIIYGEKGEKRHKTTETKEWRELLKNLPKNKEIIIINESPTLVEDSAEGLSIAKGLGL